MSVRGKELSVDERLLEHAYLVGLGLIEGQVFTDEKVLRFSQKSQIEALAGRAFTLAWIDQGVDPENMIAARNLIETIGWIDPSKYGPRSGFFESDCDELDSSYTADAV